MATVAICSAAYIRIFAMLKVQFRCNICKMCIYFKKSAKQSIIRYMNRHTYISKMASCIQEKIYANFKFQICRIFMRKPMERRKKL